MTTRRFIPIQVSPATTVASIPACRPRWRRTAGRRRQKPTRRHEALAALQESRVLVPVVAVLDEVEYDEQGLAATRPATWPPYS